MSYTRDAHELILFADNEGRLYGQKKRTVQTMMRHMAKSGYSPARGAKLWLYFVDAAAREHVRQIGGAPFSRAAKLEAAKEYERSERSKVRRGEWDWLRESSRDRPRRHGRTTRGKGRRVRSKRRR